MGGSQIDQNEMLNNILGNNQPTRGMSSLITSTTPLDLATLLQGHTQKESGEVSISANHTVHQPNGVKKRGPSIQGADEPDSKRKASNREAANRYRERKRQEMEVMRIDEEALITRNDELRLVEVQLMEEIRQMRETMTNTFGFAPPYVHEPSIFDISSCLSLSLHEKTQKRVPFPKGLSPAEQNRESVRRDREKKKARFEALKAEETILAMSRDMLGQQVMGLEAEIRELKQRMITAGLIVLHTSQMYES
ncbi:hypothetical protein PENTCL1PPCAC_23217 [Pristionchus entomophagus]|uniref:BZIP domain-containing protein n=1 Tax=Pristionchus entomophagus TaxID=358040 RepID=A0AAV5U3R7_9BILA|nr:hypothetical protein PENTCL1PPCAC_23217 [Pristionchus entomophagus]